MTMQETYQIQQAIDHLESQRSLLGDAVVETALRPLREKLASLKDSPDAQEQRKQITVMFADVSGFTALSETMDPEVVRDTMNALWQKLDGVITGQGGTIDKHIGDAVMALWGVGGVREDDTERAVRAGLVMQAEITRFAGHKRAPLAVRIGINTGPALLGSVGTTGEFTAMGDTINTASRLQNEAPVGGVLISHDSYRQIRGIFDVQPNEPLIIKGKRDPVQTYVVLRAKPLAFRTSSRGVDGIETKMVGRDRELGRLQNLLRKAIESGRTAMAAVCGEAGVGKSRLLYEFENWLELQPYTVRLFKGRAAPATQGVPFRLLRDMFSSRFKILESDTAQTVLDKFRAGMVGVLEPEKADIVGQMLGFDFRSSPAVSGLLGSPSFGKLAEVYLTNYFRQISLQPIMLFLEDIHWGDQRSLEFAKRLFSEIPQAQLFIVYLSRPILDERLPGWFDEVERIDLQPLSGQQSRELVAQVLQRVEMLPGRLQDLIVEGAEGNPYYLEELIKMLIDDGVIVPGPDIWRVEADRLERVKVPPTLTGILQSRLDGLPSGERAVLQRASVVGRRFWDAAVAVLKTGEEADESGHPVPLLDSLQKRELVFRVMPSSFSNSQEFVFKHALLRDVTYETVLLKHRKKFHSQVALWLEVNAGERLAEYLGLIANHYQLAGDEAKAARYLRKQANAQYRTSSYRDALALYQQALKLCPESDKRQRAVIHIHIGNVQRQLSDFPSALEHHSQALRLARECRDGRAEINALDGMSWALMGQGRYDDAKKHLTLALAQAYQADDKRGKAQVLFHLGDVAYRQGDSQATSAYGAECLKLYQELEDKQGIGGALKVMGFCHFMQGQYQESFHYHTQSKSMYAQIGDRWGAASSLTNQGESSRRQGKFPEAEQYYLEALNIYREIGSQLGEAITNLNLGHVHCGLQNDSRAREYFYQSTRQSQAIGAHSVLLEVLAGAALLEARAGRHDLAARTLGAIQGHPEYNDEIRANSQPALELLIRNIGEQRTHAALEQGRVADIEQLIKHLLPDR